MSGAEQLLYRSDGATILVERCFSKYELLRPSLVYYAYFLLLAKASQEQLQRLQRPEVRGLQVVEVTLRSWPG